MQDLYSRVCRVYSLTTRTARPAHLDANVFGSDFNIDLLSFRQDGHCCSRGVNSALSLRHRHPLHAMNSALVAQHSKDGRATNLEDDFLKPTQLRGATFQLLDLESVRLGILTVHPIQISSEQGSFAPTCPRPNLHNGVAIFVRLWRQQRVLNRPGELSHPFLESRDFALG